MEAASLANIIFRSFAEIEGFEAVKLTGETWRGD